MPAVWQECWGPQGSKSQCPRRLISRGDLVGNYVADALAGLGAAMHEVPANIVDEVRLVSKTGLEVLQRLVAINLACADARADPDDPVPPKR
eukprot:12833279-Heterocapsa_arctica.AAC.1